jgi:uncharacterized membrane protein YidH (DUF202 family)
MQNIFGTVNAPAGSEFVGNDPVGGAGNLITFLIQIVFLVAGLAALVYLLWGALDWLMSEGQKEKLSKAQSKIVNAIIGLLLVVVAFTVFSFMMGTVLGGKFGIDENFRITIPRINP